MKTSDRAVQFDCAGAALIGILSLPEHPAARGVLIVVGGPQYRAGSHRQFTLLARALATDGFATMRFDYRGMGDSEGTPRDFEAVGADVRSAIAEFMRGVPALREIVVWGLCDAASAALLHLADDARVAALVLLNPWVRTVDGQARTTLRHYYLGRLGERAFWRKLLTGRFELRSALRSFAALLLLLRARGAAAKTQGAQAACEDLPSRMLAALQRFRGKVLIIISGRDLTAREFLDLSTSSRQWKTLLAAPRISRHTLADADHTFSRAVWRDEVARITAAWLKSW